MRSPFWDWDVIPNPSKHVERVSLMRAIEYEATAPGIPGMVLEGEETRGRALTLNVSSGGMLILMHHRPYVSQVFKVQVPTALESTSVPTLAEVAWVRPVPMTASDLYFVGVRFLL